MAPVSLRGRDAARCQRRHPVFRASHSSPGPGRVKQSERPLPTLSIISEAMGKEIEVAILFADVVGSTKLYELLGDLRARDMVGICIDVMRAATDQNHGTVIKTM